MDEYQARYRHFNSLDTVYVQNPFDEKVTWQVADESGRQWEYSIEAHGRAELPGGLIATLGVKLLVDRLIQEDNKEVMMWDRTTRTEYEEKVILRVKDGRRGTVSEKPDVSREVDLTMKDELPEPVKEPEAPQPGTGASYTPEPKVETEFPDLKKSTSKLPKEAEIKV